MRLGSMGEIDMIRKLVSILYLVVGFVIASSHLYFTNLNAITPIISAALAVLLWPLVLVGVDLHIT